MRLVFSCLLLCAAVACGGEKTDLNVHQLLDRTPEGLKARLGEPDISTKRSEKVTTLQWRDADGDSTWVYVDLIYGYSCYVTYTFKLMEPFDEREALRRIGIDPPAEEPETEWENGAKRWRPFGDYDRLTLNPVTKAVSVSLIGSEPEDN